MSNIEKKLEAFIRKYYVNILLRGTLFFIAIGVSYFLLNLLLEHFFWLSSLGRTLLFGSVILIELLLFINFICIPLARLFKLYRGIDFTKASEIIGAHFPEVRDKLINTLQLKNSNSELALASIKQREKELDPIPFSLAINFKENTRYLKYTSIPLIIFLIGYVLWGSVAFESSYDRLVHYKKAYLKPAPFSFQLINTDLEVVENRPYTVNLQVVGSQLPPYVSIFIDDNEYVMEKVAADTYKYTFEQPDTNALFYFSANGIQSKQYTLDVVKVPLINSFSVHLDYPVYTEMKDEVINNTGNVVVPQGTKITWSIEATDTEFINWLTQDTIQAFNHNNKNTFEIEKRVSNTFKYRIETNNNRVKKHESLEYTVEAIIDNPPSIEVDIKKDSSLALQHYHYGSVSDDYGLTRTDLVYYPTNNIDKKSVITIQNHSSSVGDFITSFPDTLTLDAGVAYSYYYQVYDNDGVHGSKSSRSTFFNYNKLSDEKIEQERLKEQEQVIKGIDKNLKSRENTNKELREIKRLQTEKKSMNFADNEKLKQYLSRQQEQDKLMQNFSENLRKSLDQLPAFDNNTDKNKIQERLKKNEDALQKNEELLEELKKLGEELSKEELSKKLDKLSKQNTKSNQSLEQLLELTKRFFVETKLNSISKSLDNLSKEQKNLAANDKNTSKKQDSLNKDFDTLRNDLDSIRTKNQELKSPLKLENTLSLEESISNDQKNAKDALESIEKSNKDNRSNSSNAKNKQNNASSKMKDLSNKLKNSINQSKGEQLQEDVEMLRQILDNLLVFSFEEEKLMNEFEEIDQRSPSFSNKLIQQNTLKENFKHIDDSLFTLSLRNPSIEESITEQLINVSYSLDQSLDRFTNNKIAQGLSSQQYTITGVNTLADMLSELLDNMRQQLGMGSGSGSSGMPMPSPGKSPSDQLSDIIMSHEELTKQLKELTGKGSSDGNDNSNDGSNNNQKSNTKNASQLSESDREAQFDIYKKQQALRKQLNDLIEKSNLDTKYSESLNQSLERLENTLLDDLNENSLKQMNQIQHQLLQLQESILKQNKDSKRTSNTAKSQFKNQSNSNYKEALKFYNNKELLNREVLPLRGIYKSKVQHYFDNKDD